MKLMPHYLHSFRTLGNIVTGNDSQTDAVLAAQVIIPSCNPRVVQVEWSLFAMCYFCTPGCSSICQAAATSQDEHREGSRLDDQQHNCWKQYSDPGICNNAPTRKCLMGLTNRWLWMLESCSPSLTYSSRSYLR